MKTLSLSIIIISIIALTGCQQRKIKSIGFLRGDSQQHIHYVPFSLTDRYIKSKNNMWGFIQKESSLKIPDNQRISQMREGYLANTHSLIGLATRSEPYIYWIVDELIQRNMPIEIALLPMLESAFNPQAISSAKAAGLWQMMPSTAEAYGLTKNKQIDSRFDIIQSTNAALDMLQALNKRFNGDWLLTLAAYNCGEGRVNRAIKWNKSLGLPTHYWALNLPKETMDYVPKILALIDIFTHQQHYGISLPTIKYENSLGIVSIGQQVQLNDIANFIKLPTDNIITYNANYLEKQTPPNGPHFIVLPKVHIPNLLVVLKRHNIASPTQISYSPAINIPHELDSTITNELYKGITNQEIESYQQKHSKYSQKKNSKMKSG